MLRSAVATLIALAGTAMSQGTHVAKSDFPRFAGVLACGAITASECPGAADGFVVHGLSGGEEIPDPADPELTSGGRMVVGFLDGKPFTWHRYSVEYPNSGWKWVVLNELSLNEKNRAVLSRWRHTGTGLDLVKVYPRLLAVDLGEVFIHAKAMLPDGSLLLILLGDGSDSGVRLQDFRLLRIIAPDRVQEVHRRQNRSEIPVQEILARLNADEAVEPVMDSTLACEVDKRRAPSGGPLIKFTTTRNRVLYTKEGPRETSEGKRVENLDIWRVIKTSKPAP